ncbi:MAG TPA: HDIG domain-containing protein [Desulfobacteraceae bacterium]|nr:HDIG domain-containing protein [Desulfobacteraceae bacterium]HPQ28140.1 HDIG domain-containing protein [Desulfobacteraceae bacterium]
MGFLKKSRFYRKKDRDSLSGSKNIIRNFNWFGVEGERWIILLGLSLIISILLFPNILTQPRIYEVGDVADHAIKASREFLVENKDLTEKNREETVREVLSVYDFDPSATNLIPRIKEAFAVRTELGKPALESENSPKADERIIDSIKKTFFENLDIAADDKTFDKLVKSGFPEEVENAIVNLVSPVIRNGIVSNKTMLMNESGKGIILHNINTENEVEVTDLDHFYDIKAADKYLNGQMNSVKGDMPSADLAEISIKLAIALIKPNVTFNKRETELRKDLARKSVKPFYFVVKKGEMLVREGERITPEHLLKLSEQYKFLKQREMISRAPGMAVLIGIMLSAMYVVGLMSRRSIGVAKKDLLFNALTLLVIFLVIIACNFIAEEIARGFQFFAPRALLFAIPVASGAMLISVFQGMRIAASFSIIISVLASLVLDGQTEFFIYFFITSLVAAFGVRSCRERVVFIKTGLKVGALGIILAISIEAIYGSLYSLEALIALASAFAGGILTGVVATGILPLVEMSFGYTSDIKLLELGNLDQPLLREFMIQAPGSYHHSVIVSNMVEAAAEGVGSNPLLAKVAAYYHDIGKLNKPLYFVENQVDQENKHEKLAPSMSSLILLSHVKDGVELSTKYKLGKEITDIIRQHHGTNLISYFYEKAKEQAQKKDGKAIQVKEEDFRYPGPKPQTKEAGLIMLADVVEAASRTLVDSTASRIQGMVQKIINKVFSEGQLDECELTLKDLNEIAKSFNKTLSGIFHHRIEYPEAVSKSVSTRKGKNGNTDNVSKGDSRDKKTEDKAKSKESLKRLGMS